MILKWIIVKETCMEMQTHCLESTKLKIGGTVQELRRNMKLKTPLHNKLKLQHHRCQTLVLMNLIWHDQLEDPDIKSIIELEE